MIYKRGHVWWFEFVFAGQRVRESTKQCNQNVARQIESARRTALAKGEVGIQTRARTTFADFVPRVLAEIKKRRPDHASTEEYYRYALNRALRFTPLANARLENVNAELLSRFITHARVNLSAGSVNRSLAAIKRALRLAHSWEMINRVPEIAMLTGERKRKFILTEELRQSFLEGMAEPGRSVATFAIETACRLGEICSLTWDRVVLDAKQPYIYIDAGKTEYAKRVVPLTQIARFILEKQKRISKSKYVFVRYGARVRKELWFVGPVSRHTISKQFSARRDEMGLPWDAVFHSTRHTGLTELGASGCDGFTIQKIAGHASVTTSQAYVHPVNDTLVRAMAKREQFRAMEAERIESENVPTDLPTAVIEHGKILAN